MADDNTKQSPTTPQKQNTPTTTAPADIVLDVVAQHNQGVYFQPIDAVLRPTWEASESPSAPPEMIRCGSIPGQRVIIDLQKREARIVDRLGLPENAAKWSQVREAYARSENINEKPNKTIDAIKHPLDSEDDVATWLYWSVRLVQSGKFAHVSGKLPDTLDECRRLGKVRITSSDEGLTARPGKSITELDRLPVGAGV